MKHLMIVCSSTNILNASMFILVENREMKGTDCRKNIINIAQLLEKHQCSAEGHKIYSLVIALIELQKIAYAPLSERSPRSILRAYNQSFIFSLHCLDLFNDPKSCTQRSMFGMPFHVISVHLAETLRLIGGRSLVAEHAERHFNKLR